VLRFILYGRLWLVKPFSYDLFST